MMVIIKNTWRSFFQTKEYRMVIFFWKDPNSLLAYISKQRLYKHKLRALTITLPAYLHHTIQFGMNNFARERGNE